MDRVFSFLLWPKREARGPWKQGRKKRGSITCCTDRANEANKTFIIWLCRLFRFWKGDRELAVRTATYGPGIDQSQHAKSVSHIINKSISVTGNFLNYNDLSRNIYIVILKHVDNIKYYALVNLTPSPTPEKGEALALMACKKDKIPTYWGKMTGQNPH